LRDSRQRSERTRYDCDGHKNRAGDGHSPHDPFCEKQDSVQKLLISIPDRGISAFSAGLAARMGTHDSLAYQAKPRLSMSAPSRYGFVARAKICAPKMRHSQRCER